jgi:hypothetical protein
MSPRRLARTATLFTAFLAACSGSPATDAGSDATGDIATDAPSGPVNDVDLLLVISNGNAMRDNQQLLLSQLGMLDQAIFALPAVHTLHVGVISTDLGTPGYAVPGCVNAEHGDDGWLNPIRYGSSLMAHEPWTLTPTTYGRPSDCADPNQYPAFLTFDSTTATNTATHDVVCNVGLYVYGCGLGAPLEAIERALLIHDPTAASHDTNANFLRDGALLAILVLGDKEDASVRNLQYATDRLGVTTPGTDATDVYDAASSSWSSTNLALRFVLDHPGTMDDPTWPLDRYIDPRSAASAWLALKPGHPERIVFAAITGVPLPNDGPGTNWQNADGSTNWDMLLGSPGASGPDDFFHRDTTHAIQAMSNEGPISMLQANLDMLCPERVVPACRREGTTYNASACTSDQQYSASPGRRIVEIARRLDQDPLCHGAPCHNGMVASICAMDYSAAIRSFVSHIAQRVGM